MSGAWSGPIWDRYCALLKEGNNERIHEARKEADLANGRINHLVERVAALEKRLPPSPPAAGRSEEDMPLVERWRRFRAACEPFMGPHEMDAFVFEARDIARLARIAALEAFDARLESCGWTTDDGSARSKLRSAIEEAKTK